MKVIILAGGFGTRLSEYTAEIPKPMVTIGGKPILWHLMQIYSHFGHNEFYLALGYKSEVIKQFFLNYKALNSNFSINLENGETSFENSSSVDNWNVTLVDTGNDSMTGGRVKRLESFVGKETCLLTYGDGLSNINLDELVNFHKSHGKLVTITAVRPSARFGELDINKSDKVNYFKEIPQIDQGWINGGFFVIEPGFFKRIEGDSTVLEAAPLESCARDGELMAYKHKGFWQCMDTKRDRDSLEDMWNLGNPPWKY